MTNERKSRKSLKMMEVKKASNEANRGKIILKCGYGKTLLRQEIFCNVNAFKRHPHLQHSIVKEDIDLTAFDVVIIHPGMSAIGFQQALGRLNRAHPDDW